MIGWIILRRRITKDEHINVAKSLTDHPKSQQRGVG